MGKSNVCLFHEDQFLPGEFDPTANEHLLLATYENENFLEDLLVPLHLGEDIHELLLA